MTEPLTLTFDVACSAEHAFRVWTDRIGSWWPADHTVTGKAELVILEAEVGGRIYERTADGAEYDWGKVTIWQPPDRLGYLWHLGTEPERATEVEIRFIPQDAIRTRVEIEQRGWERLAADGGSLRDRNAAGWQDLLPHFVRAIAKGDW
jgi:uncharacterized protein YndB with AHSA1/START domain